MNLNLTNINQGLKSKQKEPVLESVPGSISRTGTDIGSYISYLIEPEPQTEHFKI